MESYGFGCGVIHVWATLESGEDSFVDGFGVFFFTENHSATWAAEGFVRSSGNNVESVIEWVFHFSGSDETGDVSNVSHSDGTYFVGDGFEFFVVEFFWVSRVAAEN